ncbi:MAG: ComEA family DNA-binding protein [Candidatus Cryptobacteroides sp.]
MDEKKKSEKGKSYYVGVIALVFMVLGYQTALFVHKAAVAEIVSHRDSPDTVFVREIPAGLSDSPSRSSGPILPRSFDAASSSSSVATHSASVKMAEVRKESGHTPQSDKIYKARRRTESFIFDPNTILPSDLVRLGFSEKQASAIDSYRKKGGRFRRKTDFAKSFVVSDSIYRRLEPYINIPLVDLNHADSAALDDLPGIGGYFAKAILAHREALGGFSCKEQLMDIPNFSKEKFEALEDLVCVDMNSLQPLRLWTMPEDSLSLLPFINKKQAHGIVLYREHNSSELLTVEGLMNAGVIDAGTADKLSRCLVAEPPG